MVVLRPFQGGRPACQAEGLPPPHGVSLGSRDGTHHEKNGSGRSSKTNICLTWLPAQPDLEAERRDTASSSAYPKF